MADGYARASGNVGIVCTITGPGVTNVTTPVASAYADSIPLLVISTSLPRALSGRRQGELHEVKDQLGVMEAQLDLYSGRYEQAIVAAGRSIATREQTGLIGPVVASYAAAADAALEMGDLSRAQAFFAEMDAVPRGERSPYFRSEIARLRARLAALRGDAAVAEEGFEEAVAELRPLGMRFHLGTALAQYGQWLERESRVEEAEPLLAEARGIFEDLKAAWWLDRLDQPASARSAAR